jgi:cytochrome bd-type quinol oxidase subunit 2
MQKIIKLIVFGVVAMSAMFMLSFGTITYAAPPSTNDVCEGIKATGGNCSGGNNEINNLVADIINIFSWVVGVVAVIMVIWGGFSFVTSAGDPQKSAKARNTILYALIGLVIVAMAQTIVRFVVRKFTT